MVPRRRRNRLPEPEPEVNEGITIAELASQHLLLVPTTVDVDAVSGLLRDRLPNSDLAGAGEIAFGRHSRLTGPYELSLEDAVDAAVPMPWTVCYCLEAPVEREGPPIPGVDDRDGFTYAFPDGLPWRDEGRALHLLVSLARRIGGAVRVGGSLDLILPDPDRAVDYIVHSPTWLEPDVLLGVVSRELPGAVLAVEGEEWGGPTDDVYSGLTVAADVPDDPLTQQDLYELHSHADQRDIQVLGDPDVIDAFAIAAEVGPDGTVEILVHLGDADVAAAARQPWGTGEFVTYEVRWVNPDPAEREKRYPSEQFLASRARVAPLVAHTARAIIEACGGIVIDEDGFQVDRYGL